MPTGVKRALPPPVYREPGWRDPWDDPDDALMARIAIAAEDLRRREQIRALGPDGAGQAFSSHSEEKEERVVRAGGAVAEHLR